MVAVVEHHQPHVAQRAEATSPPPAEAPMAAAEGTADIGYPVFDQDFTRVPLSSGAAAGRGLDYAVRAPFERAYGQSFADVSAHTDAATAPSADRIGARAYTVGSHIVFGAGQFAPDEPDGRLLLAHELAHVVQQRAGATGPSGSTGRNHAAEADADQAAVRSVLGEPVAINSATPVSIACADGEQSWGDQLLQGIKEKARDLVKREAGVAEGVALEAGNIVDSLVWLPYAAVDAVDKVVDKAADVAQLNDNEREVLRGAAHTIANDHASTLKVIRERAKSAGAVDPVTGTPSVSPLITKAGNAAEKAIDNSVAFAGVPAEKGLLTSREIGQIEGAIGTQAVLATVGVEEVQLALKVVGGIGSVKSIVSAAQASPAGSGLGREFWLAVANAALFVIGLGAASAGKKLATYFVDAVSVTLATAPPVIRLVDDLANAHGADRDEILHQDVYQVTKVAVDALRQVIQHAGELQSAKSPRRQKTAAPQAETVPPTTTRRPEGDVVIKSEVGPSTARRGYEKDLPTPAEVGLPGWQRLHAQGPGTGAESPEGILYGPKEVNLKLQNAGLERLIRELDQQKAEGARFILTTETKAHPGTLRLAEIKYRVEGQRAGERPKIVYEFSINVENTSQNPGVQLEVEKLNDPEEFLEPRYRIATEPDEPRVRIDTGDNQAPADPDEAAAEIEELARAQALEDEQDNATTRRRRRLMP